MKKFFSYTFSILLLSVFISGTVTAKKYGRRKMAGQYTFDAGNLFTGTALLAKTKLRQSWRIRPARIRLSVNGS